MDSFELNKIAGAILGSLVLVLGVEFLSELIFHSERPETPGYVIEVAEAATETEEEVVEVIQIASLLPAAEADKGERVARRCASCHSFEDGGANKVGPNLWNIVGAQAGAVDGFNYSTAMATYGEENSWTFDELDGFLANPKEHVPGTSMGFAGLRKVEDRANLIAYLRSLSNEPVPLPAE
ncbi:MAG: cytochrome c family protein [Pseudomonadota bacterium]